MKSQSLTIRTAWMFISSLVTVSCTFSQNKRVEIPTTIIKQILNHPKIEAFLRPESLGRVPLVISAQLVNPHLSLRKFGKPIHVVKTQNLKDVPYFQFVSFETIGNIAKASVRYRVEGVGGTFTFSRLKSSRWKLLKSEVWEN